ncbi:hypothetical protein ACSBR1_031045 [Camellia fascicularis]
MGFRILFIKRLNPKSNQGADEFWTEIEMLSQLWYTHLVALTGYCNDCNEMILVYEYIAHGTLADHLYKISTGGDGIGLTWDQRLNICIGAACGLDYLYTESYSLDKSKNMLGRNAMGKGEIQYESLSRFFSLAEIQSATNNFDDEMVIGIGGFGKVYKGYIDNGSTIVAIKRLNPESNQSADEFWTEVEMLSQLRYTHLVALIGDVRSVVWEAVVDTRLEDDQISLVFWARHCIETGRLSQIIDTSLRGQISPNPLKCFVEIAYKCLHDRPQERPTMAEVVAGLEFALASQHGAIIDDDHHPHPATKATKKKHPSLMKRFETSITSAVDLFLASLHSNPPYNNNFMSNDGMFTTRVDPCTTSYKYILWK